jgi:hypothetical protein
MHTSGGKKFKKRDQHLPKLHSPFHYDRNVVAEVMQIARETPEHSLL